MSFLGGFNKISNIFGGGAFSSPMPLGPFQATADSLGNKALDWMSQRVGGNSPIAQINNALINANSGMANLNSYADLGSPSSMTSLWSKFKED